MALSGCASIVEGTSQTIHVNVTPQSASCEAFRGGSRIGIYDPVSQNMTISKSRNDMTVKCAAPGYRERAVDFASSASAWGVTGGILLDAGIVDYATGALNKYDATITIVLERDADAPQTKRALSSPLNAPNARGANACTHDEEVQARIAKMNGYTDGPRCD